MNASALTLKCSLVFCLSGLINVAYGQNVYKSIDENGNVSYTSTAPEQMENVQTLAPPPEPSPAEIEAAKQRLTEYEKRGKQREQARMEQALAETQAQSVQSTHTVERIVEQQTIPVPVTRRQSLLRPQPLPARPPVNRPINRPR